MRHLACRSAMLTLMSGLLMTAVAVAADVVTGGTDSTGIGLGVGGTAMAFAGWRAVAALESIAAKGIHHHHDVDLRSGGKRVVLQIDSADEVDEADEAPAPRARRGAR